MAHYIYQPTAKNNLFNDIRSRQIEQDYGSDVPAQIRQNYNTYVDFDPYHNYFPMTGSVYDYDIDELTK